MATPAACSVEKPDIWSLVEKCVFCYKSSDGQHKLLECFHIVCKTCLEVKKTKLGGIMCVCLELTEQEPPDYPIVSRDLQNSKTCNTHNCDGTVKKFCKVCNVFYCDPCANINLNCNRNHKTFIVEYPNVKKLYVCSCCKIRDVEVFCYKCTITSCSLCHLSHHNNHGYAILEQLAYDLRKKFSSKILNLEKHNTYLNFFLEYIRDEIHDLNTIYRSINWETGANRLQSRLLTELNRHKFGSYSVVYHNVEIARNSANRNIHRYMDLLKKNNFYIHFIQSILNHGDMCNLINMSRKIWDKLFDVEHTIEFSPKDFKDKELNKPLIFADKALEACITKIKACVKLIQSLQLTTNINALNNSGQQIDQNR